MVANFCFWWLHFSSAEEQCPMGCLTLAPRQWCPVEPLGPYFRWDWVQFFILLILLSPVSSDTQRANTMAWQGKKDIYGLMPIIQSHFFMQKTDKWFDCRQLLWKTPLSYLIPASHSSLRVHTPEQGRQKSNSSLQEVRQNMQPCSPFRRSQHLKSISLHSRVQTSPLPLPEGIHTGKFPLRQKGRRRSPLETTPLCPQKICGG